jgi:hypothetical protein
MSGPEPTEVMKIERACRLPAMPLKCCCQQYTEVFDVQNQKLLGTVTENCWLCVPSYTIRNAAKEETLDIHQPTCCCGCLVDICARESQCCGLRVPFNIYYPGTDVVVGNINKIWRNFFAEIATDDDTFRFVGPEQKAIRDPGRLNLSDLDKKAAALGQIAIREAKEALGMTSNQYVYDLERIDPRAWEQGAQLLAATLMLNQIYFES